MTRTLALTITIVLAGCSPVMDAGLSTPTNPPGGTISSGPVQSRLTLKKAEISAKESIEYAVEIQNTSDAPLSFRIRWDPGCLHILKNNGQEIPYSGPAYSHASLSVDLKPAEVYTYKGETWPENYHLTPGEYQVFFFEEEPGPNNSTVVIKTAPVKLKVSGTVR